MFRTAIGMDEPETEMECSKIEDVVKSIKYKIAKKRRIEASLPANEARPLDVRANLLSMASSWDIQNRDYQINSHRPIIGDMLTAGRKLVHEEIRRYIDPSMIQQSIFNSTVIDVLAEITRRLEMLTTRMDIAENAHERNDCALASIREDARKIASADHERFMKELDDHIEERLAASLASLNLDIERKAWLADLLEGRISERMESTDVDSRLGDADSKAGDADANSRLDEAGRTGFDYLSFENCNRGSSHDIKQRQSVFLQYFRGCHNVLDIGCGRGEFLELLGENGIGSQGVDLDAEMASYSRSRGLNVERADAISYLGKAGDGSFDGIFLDQVVEHMEPDYLVRLISACHRKMAPGSHIVIETLNPQSLVPFSKYFYMDPTHKKPLHWDTLNFLLASAGFKDLDTRFFSPVPDDWNLAKVSPYEGLSAGERKALETYNSNIDKLNSLLFGMQDFAVIGRR